MDVMLTCLHFACVTVMVQVNKAPFTQVNKQHVVKGKMCFIAVAGKSIAKAPNTQRPPGNHWLPWKNVYSQTVRHKTCLRLLWSPVACMTHADLSTNTRQLLSEW